MSICYGLIFFSHVVEVGLLVKFLIGTVYVCVLTKHRSDVQYFKHS